MPFLVSNKLTHALALLCALLLAACTTTPTPPPPSPLPTTRPGPAGTGRPTTTPTTPATPTPTSTPTSSPLPTVAPQTILDAAARALRNGAFSAAADTYRALLNADDPATRSAAALGLGTALLRDGHYAEAATTLGTLLASDPNARHADAYFAYAEALRGNDQPAEAIQAYQAVLARDDPGPLAAPPSVLAPYLYDRIGDSLIALGEYTQAVETYTLALTDAPFDLALSIREKRAQAHLSLGAFTAAEADYEGLLAQVNDTTLSTHYNYYLAAQYEYLAGTTLLQAGESEAGYARFQSAIATYPDAYYSYIALVALVEAEQPVDAYQRGVVDYYAGAYEAAVRALSIYQNANDVHNGDAHYYSALSYAALDNYPAALAELQALIDTHPEAAHHNQAMLDRARYLSFQGKLDAALVGYEQFATDYPRDPLAPEALWRALLLAERNERWADAQRLGTTLLSYPSATHGDEGVVRAGIAAYRLQDRATARTLWQQIATRAPDTVHGHAAQFWLGRTSTDASTQSEAFDTLVTRDPAALYALRVADLRAGRAPFTPATNPLHLTYDEPTERAAAEAWLATQLGLPAAGASGTLAPAQAADPHLQRGAWLWRLGLYDEAEAELDAARRTALSDPLASYRLALFFRALGFYRGSIGAARILLPLLGPTPASGPTRFFARLAYPTYYADLVVPEAEKYGLDPLVVFSMIEQESLFDGFARSSAGAQGLMQIIPSTGQEIANALDWPDYATADLYRPYVNVPFGIYYIKAQRDRFNGDLYAALAAYNAGPGNAARWKTLSADNPDLFYETITLGEPRLYILLIYERWAVFDALYRAP